MCFLGTHAFDFMPFALVNTPSSFQHAMNHLLRDLPFAKEYLNDIFIFSKLEEEHVEHVKTAFKRTAHYHLTLKFFKSEFAKPKVELLGHIIYIKGVGVNSAKIEKNSGNPGAEDSHPDPQLLGPSRVLPPIHLELCDNLRPASLCDFDQEEFLRLD